MRKWIEFPLSEGDDYRQAHCDMPAGTFERELGREGFFGPASHMLHRHPPTGWIDWDGPLRPHCYDANRVVCGDDGNPWNATPIMDNAQIKLRLWKSGSDMPMLARNGDGDELIFIHHGSGDFYCDYGHLRFRDGDYLLIPRGTMWRIEVDEPLFALLIESSDGAYQLPERGILGPHAVFDTNVLRTPKMDDAFRAQQGESEWRVQLKRRQQISTVTYPFNPLDAVAWHGNVVVTQLNWRDIRPLMSHRYHLPPSAHATFIADGFVICTFCPRPIESDPGALKVPFYHSNDDYDEVLFYHRGDFFSRDNIDQGMITFHPAGFPHGPHPKALKKSMQDPKTFTDEVAVMIDTRFALDIKQELQATEDMDYVNSWRSPGKEGGTDED